MDLFKCVQDLKGGSLREVVDSRLKEFGKERSGEEIFKELCFCLLTANYSAEGGIRIQEKVGDGFLSLTEEELAKRLKELGHRFPNARAGYIVKARELLPELGRLEGDGLELREWLVRSVKGLGYKEASHFLRNIGFQDLGIVDFHIIDILVRYGMIERPKSLTRKRYMEIESVLKQLGDKMGIGLGELDLYLWYCETGKVLK
jgi:N-glycosylase/DNA lyase